MANGLFNLKQQLQGLIRGAWPNQKTPYVEYLVVAGGGGGGGANSTSECGGGGGAGGLLQGVVPVTNGITYTVTIGAGGNGISGSTVGTNGLNSVFGNITALGGGYGGVSYLGGNKFVTGSGGSGGGGCGNASNSAGTTGGSGVSGQGNVGGSGYTSAGYSAGGGGGAGTIGLNGQASSVSGNGGAGIASSITGSVVVYAGGGGAGANNGATAGVGGVGGGGNGGYQGGTAATSGAGNTGGGGGAGGRDASSSGSGGSGIVIISYPDIYNAPTFGGANSPTASTSGSGSINFTGTANQYLRTGVVSSLNMSTGDFTCEFWVYWTNLNALRIWLSTSVTGADMQIGYNATNGLYYANGTGSAVNLNAGTTSSLPANTWVHCVVVRSGTTLSLYSAGTRLATTTTAQTTSFSDLYIGCYQGNAALYNPSGYLTNLRITNTAVYDPSLSTLTVPTAPLTAISGTKLLMNSMSGAYLADSSTNSTTITQGNTGVALPTWNQASPFATGLGYKNRVYTWTASGTVTF